MTAKHTPGPWAYRAMKGYCSQLDGANGHTICCFDEDPNEADEKLIAAAPELLEALQEAENALADYIPTVERTGASLNYGHSVLKKARAAIAKAT